MKWFLSSLVLLLGILAVLLLALLRLRPPAALPATAPPERFAAGRAMEHVRRLAPGPHMGGSPAQAAPRAYLVGELQRLGLEVSVQSTTTAARGRYGAYVDNVIARKPGRPGGQTLLVVAHYDAVPFVPGASDNASSVAEVLEALRVLGRRPALRNDILVLFSDSEDIHHQGSLAFVREAPQAREARLVLNLDAAGSSGLRVLLRTSPRSGPLVRDYVAAVAPGVATSLLDEIFRRLPLGTDFDSFDFTGRGGLDLARAGSLETYHTDRDDLARLDPRGLQDGGEALVALLERLGERDLREVQGPDVVFFSFPFPRTVVHPVAWNPFLAALGTLLLAGAWVAGMRTGQVRLKGVLAGLGLLAARMGVAGGLVHLAWKLVASTRPEAGQLALGAVYHAGAFLGAFLALAAALGVAGQPLLVRRHGALNLALGGLLAWALLAWVGVLWLLSGSYLFIWPLLASSAGLLAVILLGDPGLEGWPGICAVLLGAAPGTFLVAHAVYALHTATALELVGPLAALLVLWLGTLQLPLAVLTRRAPWVLPGLLAAGTALGLLAALPSWRPSPAYPKPSSLAYGLDADRGEAFWLSHSTAPDPWSAAVLPPGAAPRLLPPALCLRGLDRLFPRVGEAPRVDLPTASVTVLRDAFQQGSRQMQLRVATAPDEAFTLLDTPAAARVRQLRINGKAMHPDVPLKWPLWLESGFGRPFDLELELEGSGTFPLRVVRVAPGFPAGVALAPRPPWSMKAPGFTDCTLVGRTHTF